MLAAVGDVVVVTVNYRLGALGNVLFSFEATFPNVKLVGFHRIFEYCQRVFSRQLRNARSVHGAAMGV